MPGGSQIELIAALRSRGMLSLVRSICDEHGVAVADVLDRGRDPGTVIARRAVWMALVDKCRLTCEQIAPLVGRALPATVAEGIAKHRAYLEKVKAAAPSGKSLPLMARGFGPRRDCIHDDACLGEFARAYPTVGASHCPSGCAKYQAYPSHVRHAVASMQHRGVFG